MATSPLGTDVNILDNNLVQIFRDSEEWLTLEYFLQMNVRTSRVKLVQAWHVSPIQLINNFEKRNSEKLVLKSFIDATSLDMDNNIQDVCTRGFSISKKGLKLSVGNFKLVLQLRTCVYRHIFLHMYVHPMCDPAFFCSIPGFPLISLNQSNMFSDPYELTYEQGETSKWKKSLKKIINHSQTVLLSGERGIFEFFLCDVGVGLSLSVSEKEVPTYNRDTLPIEYDSIFIKKKKNKALDDSLTVHYKSKEGTDSGGGEIGGDENGCNEINLALGGDVMPSYGVLPYYTFHHEYIIYDSSQLLPRFLLQFECDPSGEEHFSLPLCDYCGNAPSLFYCESDEVKLCEKCDDIIHSQNKLVKKHIRKTLNEAQTNPGKCKVHLQNYVNMFCTVCHIPICNLCVTYHAHTDLSSENFFHLSSNRDTIISLNMAYKAIIHRSAKPSNFLKKKKKSLNELLNKIDKLHEQVMLNINNAEKNVYTILEDLVKQLHVTTDKKMCSVLSEEYELKRQFNEIMWNENFLFYLQTILPPADFMNAWLKHCQCREEIEKNSQTTEKVYSLIFPDMRIRGNINVVTEGAIEHEKAYHSAEKL
ncbi:zinc finger protein, putative [Plasmodium ovale]|uniref:Zinc finger protein, putative n=2 Tax=Plasmodium ovale TaxID=36330 RepID=A0A1A8VZT4_PLAOA|nr:zinc finger protein, putative [Plasmodium ovale curtisi]SBS92618.1 zinc finger protein, putative [Plasmodium ovale curtisi]SCQ16486.1 zinc finger protein, putative [Plasmodium ovale]